MPHIDALRGTIRVLVLGVDAQQIGVGGLNGLFQLGLIHDHGAQIALLGNLIQGFMGFVVFAQFVGGGFYVGAQFVPGNLHVLDLDFVVAAPVFLFDFLGGYDGAFEGDVAYFGDEQLAGHVVFKLRDRQG